MTDQTEHLFAAMGFEREIAGGGCYVLSRYWHNGARIWATGTDGNGLPTSEDFLICVYPNGWDGEQVLEHHWFDCTRFDSIGEALRLAINEAERLLPSTEDLTDEYSVFCEDHSLERLSADELIAEIAARIEDLNDPIRIGCLDWLDKFGKRWNEAQAFEDYQAAIAAREEA